MKNLKTICLLWVVGVFMLACNNSSSRSQGEDTDTEMPEKLGKAILHTDLSEMTPLTMEELEAWLPKELVGLPLHIVHPGSTGQPGINVSSIGGRYVGQDNKEILLTVVDGAGPDAAPIYGGMFKQAENTINGKFPLNEGEEIVTIGDIRAVQSYFDFAYHYTFVHQGRLLIIVDATRLSKDEAQQIIKALPMDQLVK